MSKPHPFVMILLLCLGLTGLFAQQQNAPADRKTGAGGGGQNPQAKAEVVAELGTYVIGAEDVLDISVWQEPNVSRSVPVRPDGRISIPLVNDIQAAGLTPMQLAASITAKLEQFLTKPQVTVTVTAINSQKVFVIGEVARPGPMPLLPNMTALQALSTAGGPTQFADQKHAYVMRHEGGKDSTYPVNYRNLLRGDTHGNIILKAGDTVVVP
ncbi:MAG TPA: polysaccharide biosynthesis/export family protein [Terriglobia bacterium]|nr:polysaccharide biosynthesis/export family protein [Terriglobia bacterium]